MVDRCQVVNSGLLVEPTSMTPRISLLAVLQKDSQHRWLRFLQYRKGTSQVLSLQHSDALYTCCIVIAYCLIILHYVASFWSKEWCFNHYESRRPRLQQEASIRIGQEAKKEDQQVEAVLAPWHAMDTRYWLQKILGWHIQLFGMINFWLWPISDTLVDENNS